MKLYKLGVSNSTYNKNDGSMRWNENEEEKVKRGGERHPLLFVNFGYDECEGDHQLLLWDGTVVVVVVVDVIFLSLPPSISHFFFIQVLASKSSKDNCLLLSSDVPNHTLPFPLLFCIIIIIIITLTSRSLVFTFRQQVRSVFLLFWQDC